MRPSRFHAEQAGQALVLVGAAMVVLLGSLALSVDWGYALAARRALQNAADASAMAVGRTLATTTVVIDGTLRFMATDGQLYSRASSVAAANFGLSSPLTLTLQYGDATPTWTTSAGAGSGAEPPAGTVYVRVTAHTTYRSFFAAITGRTQVDAEARARVRLSGGTVPTAGTPSTPLIALARHFAPTPAQGAGSMFSTTCPSPCSNARTADPVELWPAPLLGRAETAIDYSRYSHTDPKPANKTVLSVVTDWDRTGSAAAGTPLIPEAVKNFKCSGGLFDTAGNEKDERENGDCAVPNWDYFGFRGTLSLTSDWTAVALPREAPTAYPSGPPGSRGLCSPSDASWQATYGYRLDPRAPCDRGDWVETVKDNIRKEMNDALELLITTSGGNGVVADRIVNWSGRNNNEAFGKAVTFLVPLWDCGELYDNRKQQGSRWDLTFRVTNLPPADRDCTDPPGKETGTDDWKNLPDRVHVLTVAPFTIYENTIETNSIRGFWGGLFVDPPADAPRPLWVLANSAYLVPDD